MSPRRVSASSEGTEDCTRGLLAFLTSFTTLEVLEYERLIACVGLASCPRQEGP